ncbi:hypothetical protein Drorol1_Dr00014862 [Drosera rotundifolia]
MAVETPVKIGTRGTVGSLLMQEMSYFDRPCVTLGDVVRKSQEPAKVVSPLNGHYIPFFGSIVRIQRKKKKKKKRGIGFLPRMCSVVDVSRSIAEKSNLVPASSYRTLKSDTGKL